MGQVETEISAWVPLPICCGSASLILDLICKENGNITNQICHLYPLLVLLHLFLGSNDKHPYKELIIVLLLAARHSITKQ